MATDPLQPHRHTNNTVVPSGDPGITLHLGQTRKHLSLEELQRYPATTLTYSYTTDHGDHGPYELTGTLLSDLVEAFYSAWTAAEVLSADGFGNRVVRREVGPENRVLLCYRANGEPLSREHGLVRLVVPSETDNALRQIKWIRDIYVK